MVIKVKVGGTTYCINMDHVAVVFISESKIRLDGPGGTLLTLSSEEGMDSFLKQYKKMGAIDDKDK